MIAADSRVPLADECVLHDLLERHGRERPSATFAVLEDRQNLTYGDMLRLVRETAAGLQALGVRQGDHVLSWLPNGLDALRVWFALNYIGAVYMPLNTEYRGQLLEHAIGLSDAKLIIAHGGLAPRLDGISRASLDKVVFVGGADISEYQLSGIVIHGPEALRAPAESLLPLSRPIEPWDTQTIILTSGTTGPSKAVLSSYAHLYVLCGPSSWQYAGENDRFMINLPMFHVGGTSCVYAMLIRGASIAMVEGFSTETFWSTIRRTGTTVVGLMGAMTPFLAKAPPSPDDRNHGLRVAVIIPLIGDVGAFAERFGVEVYTVYNMTEISTPLISDRNPLVPGTCGRPRAGVQVRIVDENDCEVADGDIGELILRTDAPWAMNHGYYKNPEATATAWRNGWFHTGDAFRRDADGNFFFVDRRKDAIRRRGENMSSFEIESEVGAHADIKEAAVVAVPSEFGEDEVLAVVVPVAGRVIDPGELIAFLSARMTRFMIPRYIRIVNELPRTPTQKVQKHLLRTAGLTADTFDREAAGIILRRERLSGAE